MFSSFTTNETFPPTRSLSRYRVKASAESLGKGNFGNTYRARLEDGRNVIVKWLRNLKPLSSDDKSPEKRPEMSEVVREVESIKVPNGDSESEDDLSGDNSLTDDSMSATPSR
ncbi:hypothetical protein LXL04_039865 [Taraxacum kok-saghyz]